MQSYNEILTQFQTFFAQHKFPQHPVKLYEPCSYILSMGGKRIRPVLCLMSHELFAPLTQNVWNTATAIELFHNFTLMHDDIMDKAPLRRGMQTVHEKYNLSTAILSGDVMNIFSYVHLSKINSEHIHSVLQLFNQTAIEICEGQQLDMDYENNEYISISEYLQMITLKTSVLLGASLKLGAILGGATDGCSNILYQFGKDMGIAFQIKDDYLDVYGDSQKTGKQIGGDILSNKKTYLITKAFEIASPEQHKELTHIYNTSSENKVEKIVSLFEKLKIKEIVQQEILKYTEQSFALLEKVPVISKRKKELYQLATMLLHREY